MPSSDVELYVDESLLERMGEGLTPEIPTQVLENRFQRCHQLMDEEDLLALVVYSGEMEGMGPEWARYFANYLHPYWNGEAFIILPREEEPVLLINYDFMLSTAKEMSPIKDIRVPAERFGQASRYANLGKTLREILLDRGIKEGRVGFAWATGQGDYSPYLLRVELEEALSDIQRIDVSEKLIKSIIVLDEYGIRMTRKTAVISSKGMEAALQALAEGVREYEAYLAYQRSVYMHGGEAPLWHYIMQSGPSAHLPLRPYIASGRKLRRGDLVLIDVGLCYKGYYNDMTRTAIIGEASSDQEKLYFDTLEVLDEMVAALRPGVKAKQLGEILREGARKRGYDRTHPLMGHGIGPMLNQPPFIMPWIEDEIQENMVINLEPGIYMPGVGGVRIEDPYLVTAEGAERLTTVDTDLFLA